MTYCTLLPLETFRQLIGFHPWHFWGLANAQTPLTSQCTPFVREYSWQYADAAGRQEVRDAILRAEQLCADQLKYSIAPHYVEEEIDVDCFLHSSWNWPNVATLGEGKASAIQTETWNAVATNVIITEKDLDGDGLFDTFVADLIDSTTTDMDDLKLYFSEDDRFVDDDLCRFEIRPVRFKRKDANTIQVTGSYWLIVRPIKYEGLGNFPGYNSDMTAVDSSGSLDPSEPSNFAKQVDFYKRTISATNTATVDFVVGDTVNSYTITATLQDKTNSQVVLGDGGSTIPCSCQGAAPYGYPYPYSNVNSLLPAQRIRINYRAGAQIRDWQAIVMRLAAAELARPICGCEQANRELARWQEDLSLTATSEAQYKVDPQLLNNPLGGTRRGHINAWSMIDDARRIRGIYV